MTQYYVRVLDPNGQPLDIPKYYKPVNMPGPLPKRGQLIPVYLNGFFGKPEVQLPVVDIEHPETDSFLTLIFDIFTQRASEVF